MKFHLKRASEDTRPYDETVEIETIDGLVAFMDAAKHPLIVSRADEFDAREGIPSGEPIVTIYDDYVE